MPEISVQIVNIRAHGAENVAAAMQALGGLLGGVVAVDREPENGQAVAVETPAAALPEPKPAIHSRIIPSRNHPWRKTARRDVEKSVGGKMGPKIVKYLDDHGGVAPFEDVRRLFPNSSPAGVNRSISKCSQLKRLDDGRIALEGYQDEE